MAESCEFSISRPVLLRLPTGEAKQISSRTEQYAATTTQATVGHLEYRRQPQVDLSQFTQLGARRIFQNHQAQRQKKLTQCGNRLVPHTAKMLHIGTQITLAQTLQERLATIRAPLRPPLGNHHRTSLGQAPMLLQCSQGKRDKIFRRHDGSELCPGMEETAAQPMGETIFCDPQAQTIDDQVPSLDIFGHAAQQRQQAFLVPFFDGLGQDIEFHVDR